MLPIIITPDVDSPWKHTSNVNLGEDAGKDGGEEHLRALKVLP